MALSTEEAEQYDRQIRLWGLEAQKRLRNSRLLLVGMRGLSAEVAKDVVLAGISALTVMDPHPLGPDDAGNRFLCLKDGENRAVSAVRRLKILNPKVEITADTSSIEDKPEEFFTNYNLVCLTSCSLETMIFVNKVCCKHGIKFICGDIWGYYGYFFTDLQNHTYAVEVPKQREQVVDLSQGTGNKRSTDANNEDTSTITEKRVMQFCSLSESWSIKWDKKPSRYFRRTPPTLFIIKILQEFRSVHGRDPRLESVESDQEILRGLRKEVLARERLKPDMVTDEFTSHCFSDLSPVCAIVGGVMAQEIIKALSANEIPLQNSFLYDGINGTGVVELLLP